MLAVDHKSIYIGVFFFWDFSFSFITRSYKSNEIEQQHLAIS